MRVESFIKSCNFGNGSVNDSASIVRKAKNKEKPGKYTKGKGIKEGIVAKKAEESQRKSPKTPKMPKRYESSDPPSIPTFHESSTRYNTLLSHILNDAPQNLLN